MNKSNLIIIVVAVALIAGAGGFFGGMQYQKGKAPTITLPNGQSVSASAGRQRFGNFNGTFTGRGGFGGGVRGTIASIGNGTMTVTTTTGSRIVVLSSTTTYDKSATASVSDLTVGTTIAANGTSNSDGSVTATTVQINPVVPTGAPVVPAQ